MTIKTVECCGLKFRICSDGILINLRNGENKKFTNGREAAVAFSREIESLVLDKLAPMLEECGYDKYSGKKEPRCE